jgi:hypothetical protein
MLLIGVAKDDYTIKETANRATVRIDTAKYVISIVTSIPDLAYNKDIESRYARVSTFLTNFILVT